MFARQTTAYIAENMSRDDGADAHYSITFPRAVQTDAEIAASIATLATMFQRFRDRAADDTANDARAEAPADAQVAGKWIEYDRCRGV